MISFGFFDGSLEELHDAQAQADRGEQVARIAESDEEALLDGAHEVVERLS